MRNKPVDYLMFAKRLCEEYQGQHGKKPTGQELKAFYAAKKEKYGAPPDDLNVTDVESWQRMIDRACS